MFFICFSILVGRWALESIVFQYVLALGLHNRSFWNTFKPLVFQYFLALGLPNRLFFNTFLPLGSKLDCFSILFGPGVDISFAFQYFFALRRFWVHLARAWALPGALGWSWCLPGRCFGAFLMIFVVPLRFRLRLGCASFVF